MNMAYHPFCFFLGLIVQVFFVLAFMEQSTTATGENNISSPFSIFGQENFNFIFFILYTKSVTELNCSVNMHEHAVEQNENAGNEWANQALKHTKCSVVTDVLGVPLKQSYETTIWTQISPYIDQKNE